MNKTYPVTGSGLGLRRDLLNPLLDDLPSEIDFLEIAPENWMRDGGKTMGGSFGKRFRALAERYPLSSHGLSLSLGSPAPLDETFVRDLKVFLDEHQVKYFTEHLSYCSDDGHLYDLMPIPFTEEAADYVAARIRRVQDILERRIAIENVSYYASPGKEIEEIDFLNAVLEKADCDLLLDVNNIYVNSINQQYDAYEFLRALPNERIKYMHVAGHYNEAEDLRVDTHGTDVIDPVWALLEEAYRLYGATPTLLERDFNIPPMQELLQEIHAIKSRQLAAEESLIGATA